MPMCGPECPDVGPVVCIKNKFPGASDIVGIPFTGPIRIKYNFSAQHFFPSTTSYSYLSSTTSYCYFST